MGWLTSEHTGLESNLVSTSSSLHRADALHEARLAIEVRRLLRLLLWLANHLIGYFSAKHSMGLMMVMLVRMHILILVKLLLAALHSRCLLVVLHLLLLLMLVLIDA